MKNGITELVFILDKSGSMVGLEADTIGGFNSMIEKQKKVEGKAYVSTILFSNTSKVLHDRKPIEEIEPLTEKDYEAYGSTALLDAIGDAVRHIANVHKYAREEDVPEHTIFIITTDGMENSSRRYTFDKIKEKIELQEKKFGWEFVFAGANIDAVEVGSRMGLGRGSVVNYDVCEDTADFYANLDCVVRECRINGAPPKDWTKLFEEDMKAKRARKNNGRKKNN